MGKLTRKTIQIDGYFDLETEDWDKFVVGGFYTPEERFSHYGHIRQDELADRIIGSEGHIWAHNGGRYDTLWLLERFLSRYTDKAEAFLAGQRIVCLKIGQTEIRDSLALIPMALEKAAAIGGGTKQQTGLDCICNTRCGGYCSIRVGMAPKQLAKLVRYLEADCIAGYKMLVALSEYAEQHDLDLCSTIGASSWRTARRWADLPIAEWAMPGVGESKAYHFAAKGYYGGRTQVFRPKSSEGFHCDVNSAYVNALRTIKLPTGEKHEIGQSKASSAFSSGKEGIYQARVSDPGLHIPVLPLRGRERIYYPVGTFVGVWTGNELRYAESRGVRIDKINKALVWSRSENLFEGTCEEIWRLRALAGPKTAMGQWLKWFGNSLTGKLAQNPISETIELNVDSPISCPGRLNECYGVLCPSRGGEVCCAHGCTKLCGVQTPLNKAQTVFSSMEWSMPSNGHVHWAAYLTAHQRTYLHAQLSHGGGLDAVYCDTDSCFSEHKRTRNLGDNLGQWEDEGVYREFESLAPKTYSYLEPAENEKAPPERVARAKGMYKPDENWEKIARGDQITQDRGVKSLKSALAESDNGRVFVRKNLVRRVRPAEACYTCGEIHIGDRILDGELTRPMDAANIQLHESR